MVILNDPPHLGRLITAELAEDLGIKLRTARRRLPDLLAPPAQLSGFWRDMEPPIEQPAHHSADEHGRDKLGRKPKPAGEFGGVGPRSRSWIRVLPAPSDAVEPFGWRPSSSNIPGN